MHLSRETARLLDAFGYRLARSNLLLTMTAAAIAVLSMVSVSSLLISIGFQDAPAQPQTLEERIAELSDNLDESARTISGIEDEVEARRRLVDDLREQQNQYEALADLKPEQVEAVAQALGEQIDEQRSFWDSPWGRMVPGFASGSFFFFLGTFVVGPWLQRHRRNPRE